MLFEGSSDVCAGLTERLNAGTLTQDDFFTVSAARASCYTTKDGVELDALVGPDKKVYLGRRDHYDNRGHYLDDDKSLIHISDTYRVFDVISGSSTPYTYDELWETRFFSDKEFSNFIALQLEEPQANAALLDTVLDEYPMPDPNISADALSVDCNYIDGDLLPLSKDRALELLERDLTVYMVQFGENPSMVFDSEELLEYSPDTIFAVPREEWEASPDFHQAIVDRLNHQEERERAFLDHGGDCFAIYQLKDGEEQRDPRNFFFDGISTVWVKNVGETVYTQKAYSYEAVTSVLCELIDIESGLRTNGELESVGMVIVMTVTDQLEATMNGVTYAFGVNTVWIKNGTNYTKAYGYSTIDADNKQYEFTDGAGDVYTASVTQNEDKTYSLTVTLKISFEATVGTGDGALTYAFGDGAETLWLKGADGSYTKAYSYRLTNEVDRIYELTDGEENKFTAKVTQKEDGTYTMTITPIQEETEQA